MAVVRVVRFAPRPSARSFSSSQPCRRGAPKQEPMDLPCYTQRTRRRDMPTHREAQWGQRGDENESHDDMDPHTLGLQPISAMSQPTGLFRAQSL